MAHLTYSPLLQQTTKMITIAVIIIINRFLRYAHHLYYSLQDLCILGSDYFNDLILIHSKPVTQEMYCEHACFAPS